MKIVHYILAALALTATACRGNQKEKETDAPVDSLSAVNDIIKEDSATIITEDIDEWVGSKLKKGTVQWSDLDLKEYYASDSVELQSFAADKDFYKDYESVLRWSPDSSYVLDIGSYGSIVVKDKRGTRLEGGEPDTEVALIDPVKQTRKRIFFVGPSSNIFDGKWVNKDNVLILGSFDETGTGKLDTLFWLVNVKTDFYRQYSLKR